jgi:hypothetical protein
MPTDSELEGWRARFLAAYPTIPVNLRNEVIALIGQENLPVTWTTAYIEVSGKTRNGDEILQRLHESGVL